LDAPLREIEALIEAASQSVRTVAFGLNPTVLHDLGLEPAVEWLVDDIRERYGLEVAFESDGRPKPTEESIRVILFRSIRELLINAAKHSQADQVRLRLYRENGSICAAVEDDGIGMEVDLLTSKGTGLLSIREHISHVGGSVLIASEPKRGTKVHVSVPSLPEDCIEAEVHL
jgi:signal transduction histidine kinase